jgi:uncharacterized protein
MLSEELIRKYVIAAHGNFDEVKTLLAAHPDLLTISYDWGTQGGREDALEAAGHVGNPEIAQYLLDHGMPLTVFAAAMLRRESDVRRFLTENPVLATTPGVHGISLMWHAALSGDPAITALVRKHGGEVLSWDLHAAVNSGEAAMVKWMLENGASDLSVKNFQEQTPLESAEAQGLDKIADLLRKHTEK